MAEYIEQTEQTCKDCFHWAACKKMLEAAGYVVSENYNPGATRCDTFIPSADVAEVVRCRDCKYFTECMAIGMCKRDPFKPIMPMPYDNYCGFGKRKDGE